ncbi:hypothetical protein [Mesonia sp. K7]|uniref:hypothetical protein n=1 Tax=Mesonia sp. K7 TaxID=2218606 RepID=UPI000DA86F0B|nr:hypothetical protein [Mesonia sp. K7]PZD76612.1 hypothetical protein DNG35_11520 [Mesonia sp. K7]
MKIVIISKNCYPTLGPRAHRTTELAKELARRGYKVIVYALLGDYDYSKISNETGVEFKNLGISKLGVADNTGYYNKKLWAKATRKLFAKWIEVPNIELMSLVKKALKRENHIDYLITIAHPHTIHWGAARFLKKNKKSVKFWVADCGDPFMKDPYNYRPAYFSNFEKSWGNICDYISVPVETAKYAYFKEFREKIRVIPQGFQLDNLKLADYSVNRIKTFAFAGNVYPGLRDPSAFLEYLCDLEMDFKFVVYTKKNAIFKKYKNRLGNKLEIRDYVPRAKLLYQLSKMDFLINIKNISSVQQPSKLIDYALTKRPVLEITSQFAELKTFNKFLQEDYTNQFIFKNIDNYDIKNVTNQFLKLYNSQS